MPPPPIEPSGIAVERLCGQPLQKYGGALGGEHAAAAAPAAARVSRRAACSTRRSGASRRPAVSSPSAGMSGRPVGVPLAEDARSVVACRRGGPGSALRRTRSCPRRRAISLEPVGELADLARADAGTSCRRAGGGSRRGRRAASVDAEVGQRLAHRVVGGARRRRCRAGPRRGRPRSRRGRWRRRTPAPAPIAGRTDRPRRRRCPAGAAIWRCR